MSIRVVGCANCDKQLFHEFGDKSFAITETLHWKPCEKCNHDLSKEETFRFCNWVCLCQWVDKRRK